MTDNRDEQKGADKAREAILEAEKTAQKEREERREGGFESEDPEPRTDRKDCFEDE